MGKSGYSLVETLIALVILLLMIHAIGSSLVTVLIVERKALRMGELSRVSQDLVTDHLLGFDTQSIMNAWPHDNWALQFEAYDPRMIGVIGLKQDRWSIAAKDGLDPTLDIYLAIASPRTSL
ncbi:MAG: type II secretory pathway pseudopilin PulG [Kiritimatiellia bacterium]|jgi:type II secretory pathway pseudopilin PulG